ncbi:MAG: primosomal protein N' [Alphaproteobacteria bacterium]|nr:primosomal protein N' [Alphaproteobacteria bacterium]
MKLDPHSPPSPRVRVLFPTPLDKPFDYLPPAGDPPAPGAFVVAPFAGRSRIGVVWPDAPAGDRETPIEKLKSIDAVLASPPLGPDIIDFIAWVADYTMSPLGSALRLVIRSGDVASPPSSLRAYRAAAIGAGADVRLTEGRRRALIAAQGAPKSITAIAADAGVGAGVVRGLLKSGLLESADLDPDAPFDAPRASAAGAPLSDEQSRAAAKLVSHVRGGEGVMLLDGVTGAGKTEVYLEAVAETVRADPEAQVLIMMPEIALTLPFLKRIQARFGAEPAAWHSELGAAERRRAWRRAADGNARIVVGARSALFLPYKNLKLIVVDEEHETGYKQEDGVVYQGRDLAVARGARARFPVILASATPSLETVVNVDQGRYGIARLRARFGGATTPDIRLVDLRRRPPERETWLAPDAVDAISATIGAGEQALLFLNRRGYAPVTICRKCGERIKSPCADAWLVEHRFENRLVCHLTGYSMPKPDACPSCKAVGSLAPCGPGVERIAEESLRRWPAARQAILSSDTAPTPSAMRDTLDRMAAGEIDLLIATQVVAKGHHFPNLTLVVVVDADMGLAGGDLRAGEKTYQLISQVAGRAGRAAKPGAAILQTHQPEAPVLAALAAGDRDAFLAAEAAGREAHGFPPYGRLAAIILRSKDETALRASAAAHRDALFPADGVEVMGPAPAPIYRLRGEMRMRFLVKARRNVHVQRFLAEWLGRAKPPNAVRRNIDIDPYSFL